MGLSYKIEDIITRPGFIMKELQYEGDDLGGVDLGLLSRNEISTLGGFGSAKRKLEYYFTRVLWASFDRKDVIGYDADGRPFAREGHISISHSGNRIVIAYDEQHPAGVDIEHFSPKIRKIKHKFISIEDESLINAPDDTMLTVIWSIKEAIYKMERSNWLSFKDHIHVSLNMGGRCGKADVIKDSLIHHYDFNFILRGDHVITYCSFADLTGQSSQIKTLEN